MGEEAGKAVVDTYALMAMVFGELGDQARRVMLDIYEGRVRGLVPSTVGYEFALQWLRGKVPGLSSLDEVQVFLGAYFEVVDLGLGDFVEIARIKFAGDEMLASSGDGELTSRRLSLVDSSVILVGARYSAPIVTGDRGLSYVAEKMGLRVLW